jgi:hypothetical protein
MVNKNERYNRERMPESQIDIRGGLPAPDDDIRVDTNMTDIVREKLQQVESFPLVKPVREVKPDTVRLEEIIKPMETIIKTGEPLDNNTIIKGADKTPIDSVRDILIKPIEIIKPIPKPIPADVLNERDKARLFAEEDKRRQIEDERFTEFKIAIEEDFKRRRLFDDEIRLMKEEFDIYLKKTFPEFVGDRSMKNSEVDSLRRKNEEEKRKNEESKKQIQQSKIQRLESEKKRKLREKEFQINKLTKQEVQTFFEEDILIEQRGKLSNNEELEGLNDVQKTIRDVKLMEIKLGRPIIPHRDIVESDESDFDRNSYTKSNDILIKPKDGISPEEEEMKRRMMEELRYRLDPNGIGEADYVSKDR